MAGEEGRRVVLGIILPQPFDAERVCSLAASLAEKHRCDFNGLFLGSLPTQPASVANTLTFTLELSKTNELIHDITAGLGIDEDATRFTIVPSSQGITRRLLGGAAQSGVPTYQNRIAAPVSSPQGEVAPRPWQRIVWLLRRTWGAPISISLALILVAVYFASSLLSYALYLFALSAVLLGGALLRSPRAIAYLMRNWGSPFIIAFILLLIGSAAELSTGSAAATNAANGLAVYAFYSLVLGVALQIGSYVRYGEGAEAKVVTGGTAGGAYKGRKLPVLQIAVVVVLLAAVVSQGYLISETTDHTTGVTTETITSTLTSTVSTFITTSATGNAKPPPGALVYPNNLTRIAQALAKNGTVTFWYPAGTSIGQMITDVAQTALAFGGPTTTAGQIVAPNMYRITGTAENNSSRIARLPA